jgi:starch-binding outer membrane protein, SusD/RagB family
MIKRQKMKKIFSTLAIKSALLVVLITGFGCKKNILPSDSYTDAVIWQNPDNVNLYVYRLYEVFQNFKFGKFSIGYDNVTDGLTDLLKYTSTSEGNGTVNNIGYDPGRVNSSSPGISYWDDGYVQVRRVNEFLNGLEKYAKLNEEQKLQFEAEARFIRGFIYFHLVKIHGSVIILEKLATDGSHARSSEDDCWNFVANDFAFAAEHLPVERKGATAGRASKGAAYGMLARTWLYAASIADYDKKLFNADALTGVPADKKTPYYQNAVNAAEKVIQLADEGYYKLEDDFATPFKNKYVGKESLFSVQFLRPQLTHQYDLEFAPPGDVSGYGGLTAPTAEMVDAFEMADGTKFSWANPLMANNPYEGREPRFYASILYNDAPWKGDYINTTAGANPDGFIDFATVSDPKRTVTGYYARKMLDQSNTDILISGSEQNWIEMRYAEVLLIHAEAKLGVGDLPGAKKSLDKVRARVGLPGTTASNATDMFSAIEHERVVELAFEGHRYWDLRRWRKAHIVLNNVRFHGHKITGSDGDYTYQVVNADNQNRMFPTQFYYMPIPQSEVLKNPLMIQIKGW